MNVILDENNAADYARPQINRLFPGSEIVGVSEVTEQTYVNWIFRVDLNLADGNSTSVYLRQSRDRVKTRPEIPVRSDRVAFEVNILKLINSIVPDTVPTVLFFDKANNISISTDVRRGAPLLVNELVAGRVHPKSGTDFGHKIGAIHRSTLDISDQEVRGSAQDNKEAIAFHLGMRLAPSQELFPDETAKLVSDGNVATNCLVLGDLASKNIFVDNDVIRFLDLERAWNGDPAFDSAFLFSHYLLEVPPAHIGDSIDFIHRFMKAYRAVLSTSLSEASLVALENRILRYLGVCVLYRIDGLYLVVDAKEDKEVWRNRAAALISDNESTDVTKAISVVLAD